MQIVDNYEYELPPDFEDEEIDEDEAFNSEDERIFGHMFDTRGGDDDEPADESEEDNSDDLLLESDSESDKDSPDNSEEEMDEDERQLDALFNHHQSEAEEEEEEEQDGYDQASEQVDDEDTHDAMVKAVVGNEEIASRGRGKQGHHIMTEASKESELNVPAAGESGSLYLRKCYL